MPSIGGGPNVRLKCSRGEGAILNVQSGKATYRYCDRKSKMRLGDYMLKNYRRWLSEHADERFDPRELFLVTGTYMTQNWEAATFQNSSTSVSGDITVDAVLAKGKMSIDWRTWTQGNRGFRLGHTHIGQNLPNHNTIPSFGACCNACEDPPENQCIFLRGWQVRPVMLFANSKLTIPISVENLRSVEWRRAQLVRKSPSHSPMTFSSLAEGEPGSEVIENERFLDLMKEIEAEEVPSATYSVRIDSKYGQSLISSIG